MNIHLFQMRVNLSVFAKCDLVNKGGFKTDVDALISLSDLSVYMTDKTSPWSLNHSSRISLDD